MHVYSCIEEPWHADVFDFLELRKNHGKEEQRARDLFFGLWVPDLFMKRHLEGIMIDLDHFTFNILFGRTNNMY